MLTSHTAHIPLYHADDPRICGSMHSEVNSGELDRSDKDVSRVTTELEGLEKYDREHLV